MKVVLYAKGFSGVGERLQNIIEALVPKRQTWICKTVDSLWRKLRRPMNGVSIAILLAATKEELLVIYSMTFRHRYNRYSGGRGIRGIKH